jgi:putative ABC transport system permease protein
MRFLLETIRLGLNNLRLHLLRSVLTALGIILGVGAVIVMASLGEGAKRDAMARIEALGARNIIVRSNKPIEAQAPQSGNRTSFTSKYGLTRQDFENIVANFPEVESIVPLKAVGGQVWRGERRDVSQAFGTMPELLSVANLRVERGRYLSSFDIEDRTVVCVIGAKIAKDFFPLEDPIGQTLRIDQKVFTVIGVLAPVGFVGAAGASKVARDLNLDIHIPITTARQVFGDAVFRRQSGSFQSEEVQVNEVIVTSRSREDVLLDAQRLERLLQVRKSGLTDIAMTVPYELLETAKKQSRSFQLVFGSIAGISLLVGGIGIMNIMLASVTERTREIGIRRALGATRRHILWQFLVETSVLSTGGGLIGVGLGAAVAAGLERGVKALPKAPLVGRLFETDIALPTSLAMWSIFLSFFVAVLTGLVFGIYPARKAAAQDPIVALRHD